MIGASVRHERGSLINGERLVVSGWAAVGKASEAFVESAANRSQVHNRTGDRKAAKAMALAVEPS